MSTDFMSLHRPGIGNAASYQVSGIPWVSSSLAVPASGSTTLEISFPQVTKSIIVKNVSTGSVNMRVGFSDNGVKTSNNFFILSGGESFAADLKVTRLYLMSNNGTALTASVIAGLTNIPATELTNNWSGSLGVG
jgi:hypothetical protein